MTTLEGGTTPGAISCPHCGAWMYQTTGGWHCSQGCVRVTTYPDTPGETHYVQICTCGQACPMHPNAGVDLPSVRREAAAQARQESFDITCECGRGPRETMQERSGSGVYSYRLATHCTECLAGDSEDG